jgi:hypothetical protein
MKFNTSMPIALKPYFQKELTEAENTFTKRHFQQSWRHLERALLIINEHLEPNQRSNQDSAKVSANCTVLLSF